MELTNSKRYFKVFSPELFLTQKLTKPESDFYLRIKKAARYKDSEKQKRGTLKTTYKELAVIYKHSISNTQKIIAKFCNMGLCETATSFRGRQKKGTIITFCFYDSCEKSESSRGCQNDNVDLVVTNCESDSYKMSDLEMRSQKREIEVAPYIYNTRSIIDRKDILKENREILLSSESNLSLKERAAKPPARERKKRVDDLDFENIIFLEKFMETKNELENLKREVENLKNENLELKTSLKTFFELFKNSNFEKENASLNTEKINEERKSCGKKKNTAVLSDDNLKNDKLYQSGGENAEEGLKMAKNGNSQKFVPPTVEEVAEYCRERRNGINAEMFVNFYESKGWYVGKHKMRDWRACVRTWEQKRNYSKEKAQGKNKNDWSGDNEMRFKENLKLVTNTQQWRQHSMQAYVDFTREEKLQYYNEFIFQYAENSDYTEIFYDSDLQARIKEHFTKYLNVKLAKKQENTQRQEMYQKLNAKKNQRSIYERIYDRLEQQGIKL